VDPLEQVRPRHGSDVGAGHLGVAHGQRLDLGDEQTGELLDDGGVDDEALRRDAALPGVEVAAPRGHGRDARQVGVSQDDERVGPAQLEHRLLDGVARGRADSPTGPLAARDGDRADAGVLDQPPGDRRDVRVGHD
jgi:hypothetical protein